MRSPEDVVREFWRLMATNDFDSVTSVLADGFVMEWPQSRERIRSGANFTVDDGRITRLVEYWPEPFEPRPERRHLVERMEVP